MGKILRNTVHFFSKQSNIIYIFSFLMLVPNLFLAYTESYTPTIFFSSIFLCFGFYTLLCTCFYRVGIAMLLSIPLMVLGAFQLVLLYMFGHSIIGADMFTNLMTTNSSEASELLSNITPPIIGVIVLYLPLIILSFFSINSKERLTGKSRIRARKIGLLILLLGILISVYTRITDTSFRLHIHIFPTNVIYNIKRSINLWDASSNYPQSSKNFHHQISNRSSELTDRKIIVLVIGEAARAKNWHLFGYSRPTTPYLSSRKDIFPFSNILTENNSTHKSVPLILSSVSAENWDSIYMRTSIISLFNETAYHTAFITNQPPNNSLTDFFASKANTLISIYRNQTPKSLDREMLAPLRKIINEDNKNLFIVLHTYGSHFNYMERYEKDDILFIPDKVETIKKEYKNALVNSYDNSIRYTDLFLNKVISTIDSIGVLSALLYCSDHGEDLMDDRREYFLHSSPKPTYYQLHVACFAWFSAQYREQYPYIIEGANKNRSSPASTSSVFHTLTDIANINTPYTKIERSLTSLKFRPYKRTYLNDYYKPIGVEECGISQLDIQLINNIE